MPMNRLPALVLTLALTAAGCASQAPEPPPQAHADPRIAAFQRALDEALAQKPALARRFTASVIGVADQGDQAVFSLDVERAASFGREARRFDLLTSCAPDALNDCVRKALQAMAGAVDAY